jgi:hypothetical protein
MSIDYANVNRRDVAELALHAAAMPDYAPERAWIATDINNELYAMFPSHGDDAERYGYGHVLYAAETHVTSLATSVAWAWGEYQDAASRFECAKRSFEAATHDAHARYDAMCRMKWTREYRDQSKARALEMARELLAFDREGFMSTL